MKPQMTSEIWNDVCAVIRQRVSADGYERWFSRLQFLSNDDTGIALAVPNPIHQFFLESNYMPLIHEALTLALGCTPQVRIVADDAETPVVELETLNEDMPRNPLPCRCNFKPE